MRRMRNSAAFQMMTGGAILAALLLVPAATAQSRPAGQSLSQLLVDIARDQGLASETRDERDIAMVATLLKAAQRLDARNVDAAMWLYELHAVSGEEDTADAQLARIANLDPDHETAFERWLQVGEPDIATLEDREKWLHARLDECSGNLNRTALVHVQLAHAALERLDRAGASEEVRKALASNPNCPAANAIAWDILAADAKTPERLRAAINLLRINPIDPDSLFRVGAVLDYEGLDVQAGEFLEKSIDVMKRLAPDQPVSGSMMMALARNRYRRGLVEPALDATREVLATDPTSALEAGMFLGWALLDQGRRTEADALKGQLAERFAMIRDPDRWGVAQVAQAAWFYIRVDPQPVRALSLAEAAAQRAGDDAFVRRVLGWAQDMNGKKDEARATLEPIAAREPYAALLLARYAKEVGDEAAARSRLEKYLYATAPDPAIKLIREFLPSIGVTPATQPSVSPIAGEVDQLLAGIDRELWGYLDDPSRFLDARIIMESRSPGPADAWWAEFSITNRSKSVITLGHDGITNPTLLLSFEMEGDRKRSFPDLFTINLDRRRTLAPGETVKLRRTIDVGPQRRASRQTPQQLQRVTVRAVLDPQMSADGAWQKSPTGQALRPVYFNRVPASGEPASIAVLFAALGGADATARDSAIMLLAQLLGERQRADLGRLNYSPDPVPSDRIEAALVQLLGSGEWEVRTRTLDALQMAGLSRGLISASEKLLKDPNWLVRFMAVRLLGRRGDAFREQAAEIARSDADELVRACATYYATPPATQPSVHSAAQPADGR